MKRKHTVTFDDINRNSATEIIAQTIYRCGTMTSGQIYSIKVALSLSDADISLALRNSIDRVDEIKAECAEPKPGIIV